MLHPPPVLSPDMSSSEQGRMSCFYVSMHVLASVAQINLKKTQFICRFFSLTTANLTLEAEIE